MSQRTCSEPDCDLPHNAKGLCKKHYRRQYYVKNGDRERANFHAWRDENLDHEKTRWAAYYEENADRLRVAGRVYYDANQTLVLERAADYRRRNPDAYKVWRERHPDRWAASNRANQHRRRANGKTLDFNAIIERDGMVCHICKRKIDGMSDLHFDHVIPLATGGPHSVENIRPAHASCNMAKGSKFFIYAD